jgi:ribosomal protein S18 acetylase RimI-like enzyme
MTIKAIEPTAITVVQAQSPEQIDHIRKLFTEYATSLNFEICFQSFEKELAELPGEYAPPKGRLLLALCKGQIAGCVALKKIDEGVCEMKRLYVPLTFRGKGIGRSLAETLIKEAREIGYDHMRLETIPSRMQEAVTLYDALGFKSIAPDQSSSGNCCDNSSNLLSITNTTSDDILVMEFALK